MTTEAAAALYLAQHQFTWSGLPLAQWNPHNLDVEQLPVIYGFAQTNSPSWIDAVLLTEDGHYLGGHICSDEGYIPADLGLLECSRPDRHETFRAHYPDGYRMVFVSFAEAKTHEGLKQALKANQLRRPQS